MRFTAKSYLSGGSKLCCKNVDRTKYGKPIRRSIFSDRKFLQEKLQKPGQPYKTGEQQQTGRLWQAGEKNKLRRSYWSFASGKGVLCGSREEVVDQRRTRNSLCITQGELEKKKQLTCNLKKRSYKYVHYLVRNRIVFSA